MLLATRMVLSEEQPDDCYSYDHDEDRRRAPGVYVYGYVPLKNSQMIAIATITTRTRTAPGVYVNGCVPLSLPGHVVIRIRSPTTANSKSSI